MSNLLLLNLKDTQIHSWPQFQSEAFEALRRGSRLVSFFGSPGDGGDIFVNAVFVHGNQKLGLIRAKAEGGSYPCWTTEFPQFHCFERELFEQFGLEPAHHPWLKPVRSMEAYQFFKIDGKEIHEVGVGPIHAGVIEPGHFRFMCFGETIHHLEIQLGYQHRALEKLLSGRDPLKLAHWLEVAAGDTTVAHTWAYCRAVEGLCGATLPMEANVIRAIALELERIAMHLSGLAGICADIAYLPGASYYGRLRTAIINASMRICGSRFSRGWLRPGGVCFRLNSEVRGAVLETLNDFMRDLRIINRLFENSISAQHRLVGTGVVLRSLAESIGLVGLAARSSGVSIDLRVDLKHQPYGERPITAMCETSGDCWARSKMRIREIEASLAWILSALGERDEWTASRIELPPPPKEHLAVAVVEGWRGEVVHVLETGKSGEVRSYRIQDPSLRNWMAVAQAVRGGPISDFPICNKSFDLSYCGNDL